MGHSRRCFGKIADISTRDFRNKQNTSPREADVRLDKEDGMNSPIRNTLRFDLSHC